MPLLDPNSRESGIELAVGCFLLALGVGLLIPRPGVGLYSLLRSDGFAGWWSAALMSTGLVLGVSSNFRAPRIRLAAVAAGMVCWVALALRFGQAQLWGAMLQSLVGMFLMNACGFRLFHYLNERNKWLK